jgi:hypothetical protein
MAGDTAAAGGGRLRPRRPVAAALARLWAEDHGLSLFSVMLLVAVFVVPPFVEPGSGRSVTVDAAYWLLLISGVRALSRGPVMQAVLLGAAVVAIAVSAVGLFVPVPTPWELGTGILSIGLLLVVILGRTLRDGPVTTRRLHGGVAAYLLLGVLWAYAYALVAALRPGAFVGPMAAADGARAFLYFSFVTLTTTGFGDVLPIHPAARSLATLEAVTGTLYLAILISRLVSQAVSRRADV